MYREPRFDYDRYRHWLEERARSVDIDGRSRLITLSRQFGCEGYPMAAALLRFIETNHPNQSWIVFSHPIMEKLISDETLGVELIDQISEKRYRFYSWFFDGIVPSYLQSPQSVTFERLRTLILNLAEKGNCIIIGGGAQIISKDLDREKFATTHFRIVAPESFRVEQVMRLDQCSRPTAQDTVTTRQSARSRFVADFTGHDSNDPTLYHLTFNNELIPPNLMAHTAYQYLLACGFFHAAPERKP